MLTIEERVFLVEHVFREGGKYTRNVREKFCERFPNTKCPNRDSVHNIVNKFRATGSVHDVPRSGRPTVLTDEKLDEIANIMLRNPKTSTRKLAKAAGISMWTAHKAVINKLQLRTRQERVKNMRVDTQVPTAAFHDLKDDKIEVPTAAFHESKYVKTQVPTEAYYKSMYVKSEVPTAAFHDLKDDKIEVPTAAFHESKYVKTQVPTEAYYKSMYVKSEVPTAAFHDLKDDKIEVPTAVFHESKAAETGSCCIS